MPTKVFISGVYSGPSPSAGLGIARCLKNTFPELHLVGVDHWMGSSGLQHDCFSERIVLPAWNEIDKKLYQDMVRGYLNDGHYWISSHDIEVDFLTKQLTPHPHLLLPNQQAFRLTAKPNIFVKELLPFQSPEQISLEESDSRLYDFCRSHSWRVWLKGPYHEATAVTSWREFENVRRNMTHQWPLNSITVQAHIGGYEESICLAAYEGKLLDVIKMEKRVTTAEGKTWAGRILDLEPEWKEAIEKTVKEIGWSGGAEIELLRDMDDKLWLMEWNPRFPAWIYGTHLAGRDLPSQLLAAASLTPYRPIPKQANEFTRVVLEIPVNENFALPLPQEPLGLVNAGKYGAGIAHLAKSMLPQKKEERSPAVTPLTTAMEESLTEGLKNSSQSPEPIFLSQVAQATFSTVRSLLSSASTPEVRLIPAYSFKTSPDLSYLSLAKANGYLAECISQWEVQRALEMGFEPHQIILNGPGKWWPTHFSCPSGLRSLYCDSVEELNKVVAGDFADTVGIRVRLPSITSRFGIPVGDFKVFQNVVQGLKQLSPQKKIGLHYHMASSAIGVSRWFDAFDSLLSWAQTLENAVGKRFTTLDLGGGWLKEDFERVDFEALAKRATENLPGIREIHFEPGKALTQETMALRTRVLEVRQIAPNQREVVVDGCIAELPLANVFPHRVVWRNNAGALIPLSYGSDKILGRICMEDDFLHQNIRLPEEIRSGDDLIFLDSGAYERSMSYDFGRGGY